MIYYECTVILYHNVFKQKDMKSKIKQNNISKKKTTYDIT